MLRAEAAPGHTHIEHGNHQTAGLEVKLPTRAGIAAHARLGQAALQLLGRNLAVSAGHMLKVAEQRILLRRRRVAGLLLVCMVGVGLGGGVRMGAWGDWHC